MITAPHQTLMGDTAYPLKNVRVKRVKDHIINNILIFSMNLLRTILRGDFGAIFPNQYHPLFVF